ncbi:MAG: hypothetical protein L0H25_07710 [Micrococcales bacterium]|nr:hypothetical protein [Micrococcales bacterium]
MTDRPRTPSRHRTPNFRRFIITGALIGLVIGVFLGMRDSGGPSYSPEMNYSDSTAIAFLGVVGVLLGGGLGAGVAVLFDRTGRDGR